MIALACSDQLGIRRIVAVGRDDRVRGGDLRDLHVLGQVDQHRARPPFARDPERIGEHLRDVARVAHQEAVLHDRQGDAEDIDFLERVGARSAATRPGR